ncbi:PQQ-binding-like beta-propeller repeat protein [Archaeoglobus profundus]|nr:hypothetical protein [Archaeoglobus profundus]
METQLEEAKEIKLIKPADRWVYCKRGEIVCYENILVGRNFVVSFDKPIFEISVDKTIAVRTENEVALIGPEGNIIWRKKIKANAVSCRNDKVAVGVGKKVLVLNGSGEKVLSKRVGKVLALDFDGEIFIVATDKGIKCLNSEGEELWKLHLKANLVRVGYAVAVSNYNDLILLTRDGHVLWSKKLDGIVYDVKFGDDGITAYTYGSKVKFDFEGRIVEVVREEYDFKFLPLPHILVQRKIDEIKSLLKLSKDLKPKSVKRLVKQAKKYFKRREYGRSYEFILTAIEELERLQLVVELPKKVYINEAFNVKIGYKNVLHDVVENLVVDLTDLEKYFEVEPKMIEFPPVRRGMVVRSDVKIVPKYEGTFKVIVNARSSVGELSREFEITVARKRLFRLFRREKGEETLLELLE